MKIDKVRRYIAIGYCIIVALIGSIAYFYQQEWNQMEALEDETRRIHTLRENVHRAYAEMLDLTMFGETILEWEEGDTAVYRRKRMKVDSLLCDFKNYYSGERLDSVRMLLAEKEIQLFSIARLFDEQSALHEEIAERVPVIAYESTQEPKRKGGFFGLFKKKEQSRPTTTTKLYSLNREVVRKQSEHTRKLSETADSLANRNVRLNEQLQTLIKAMDERVQTDLQQREKQIKETRRRSATIIGGLTVFIFLLLIASYFIIHRNVSRIVQYRKDTSSLIRKQKQVIAENTDLLNARQKMMHTITHELRIPLSSIIGYSDLLDEETDEEKQRQYMENIKQASGRMASQLNTLLSFFRLDCGKEEVNLAPFRLTDIVDTLEREFRTQIEAKDVAFFVKNCEDYVVIGDKERIIQIGDNLLSNALKFTSDGLISLEGTYKNGTYNLFVNDTGTGMPKGELSRIFKSFERLSNAATQEGFGLGLSIVDNLVRLLGGSIRVSTDVGIGTSVSVDIPVTRTDERLISKSQQETIYPKRNYSVVAIDNNVITLDMIKAMFTKYDVSCDICVNAGELMELIRNKRYDLLITDLSMPGLNGYDILELLRTSNVNNSKTIPVIAATASGSCTKEELLEKGFSDCIFKPFSKQDLLEVADRNIAVTKKICEEPDFSILLAYGDKVEMLDKVISVTEQDMQDFKDAGESKDIERLNNLIHHLRSSWGMLNVVKPLWGLHILLNDTETYSDEQLQDAINSVLETGENIIRCANEKKKEVANG